MTKGSISIGNEEWSLDDLEDMVIALSQTDQPWKLSVARFIQEWINDDDHVDVHTSGTTGTRKSIRLSKALMKSSAQATGDFFNLQGGSTALLCLSTDYIAGKMMIVRGIELDWRLTIVEPESNPLLSCDGFFDFCAMVPLQVQAVLDDSGSEISRLKTLIIGGAAISNDLNQRLQESGITAFATYGMTETATHIALRQVSPVNQTHYIPLAGYIVELDHRGCIQISGQNLAHVIVTNDAATLTDQGFTLRGRIDNVINSGGVKVFPEEIEAKLNPILSSETYYITSSADDALGEKVTLVIEGNPGNAERILENCSQIVDAHTRPRRIIWEPVLERTPTGKIIRKKFE